MPRKKSTRGGVIKKVPRVPKDKVEAKVEIKDEKKTEDEIVYNYIEKLKKQVEEKELSSYIVFMDTGFADKIKNTTVAKMEKIMKKNPKMYAGRKMVRVMIKVTLPGKHILEMKKGMLIFCDIFTAKITDKGIIDEDTISQISMRWEKNDLGIAKFTMKLIEKLARLTIKHNIRHVDLFGVSFDKMVSYFKHLNLDILKYLDPLEGVSYKKTKSVYD
jgi:hypothetical protein